MHRDRAQATQQQSDQKRDRSVPELREGPERRGEEAQLEGDGGAEVEGLVENARSWSPPSSAGTTTTISTAGFASSRRANATPATMPKSLRVATRFFARHVAGIPVGGVAALATGRRSQPCVSARNTGSTTNTHSCGNNLDTHRSCHRSRRRCRSSSSRSQACVGLESPGAPRAR